MKSFFDTSRPLAFAHRGGDEQFPENTLAAFQDAYKLGYRYFETDVHYTVDHELIAFHDGTLHRMLGFGDSVSSLTKADRQTKLLNSKHQIPLLSELLEMFPDAYFNIDAKDQAAVKPLIETLKEHGAIERVCLASFSAHNINGFRNLLPGVPTVATRYEVARLRFNSLSSKHSKQVYYLQIPEHLFHKQRRVKILNRKFIDKLHHEGHKVFVWTINDPAEMHRLLDMGVDGIFTDKVRVLKDVLVARKQWVDP